VTDRKGVWPIERPLPLILRVSLLEQVEEDIQGERADQVYLENGH